MDQNQTIHRNTPQTTDAKKIDPKSEPKRYSEIFRDFDNLDLSLISCAGEDLLADSDTQSVTESDSVESKEQSDACCEDSLFPLKRDEASEADGTQSAQEADLALCRCEDGVETALQYTKMWCRYAKDLLAWMEKRISLEQEFAKNVTKTAEGAKTNVGHQEMMPLQYIYTMALEQDIKNSVTSRKTAELLHNRCYQSLASKKNEIDKWRREFKEQWAREQRRMNESVTLMKKARQQYFQRCDELEKAKAISAKTVEDAATVKTLDKRRKCKDEAQSKVMEAELQYRQCLNDAKIQQNELVKVKERIICHIRKLICQGDSVLKEATVNMFYYQRQQTEPVPLGYHNLEMTCRSLEPGEPYLFYILSKHRPEHPLQVFTFQDYVPPGKGNKRKTSNPTGSLQEPLIDDNAYGRPSDGKKKGHSDSESIGGSLESLSSPAHTTRRLGKPASTLISSDDLDERDIVSESECIDNQFLKARVLSRAVLTHKLRKMKSKMIKCKLCDNYIVVSGVECEECGLALHRKCMESCQLECEHRKGTVFGVDLSVIPLDKRNEVPFVVLHCTSEIEHRALSVQGVYRVSGSKPRIQKLCQAFETQKELVDMSEYSPHDITSILKQFFKELPEPLLTFDLYNGFVTVGKNIHHQNEREPQSDTNDVTEVIHKLQDLLQKLPSYCYSTLQHLISHLHKVSENDENKMSPSNLGIVFGPTLLRPLVSTDMSLMALLETTYQAAVVEFLIIHHARIFGLQQISCTPPPSVPKASLPDTPRRASFPLEGEVNSEHETSSSERPLSVEQNRTIKSESIEGCISDKSSWNQTVDQLSSNTSERAVLAMRKPLCSAQEDPVEQPVMDLRTQTHYRFTRQPVKYYRHYNPRTRLPNVGYASRQPEAPTRGSLESADDSLSSSPEAATQRTSLHLCAQSDTTGADIAASGHKADAPLSPREVVEYMLGLDSTFTLASTETSPYTPWDSPLELADECQANQTMTRPLSQAPKMFPTENKPSAPAHKILSGLKLRRSHSGKEEQLFV